MSKTTSHPTIDPDDAAADLPGLHPISAASVRKLWPTEGHLFRDHLLRLDKDSRRMRFAHGVSDSFIEDYAARSQREVADKAEALSFLQQYEGFVEWFDLTDADGNVIEV